MVRVTLVKPEVRYPVKVQGLGGDVGIPTGLLSIAAHLRTRTSAGVSVADYRLRKAQGLERNLFDDFRDADIVGTGGCTVEVPDALNMLRVAKQMGKVTVMGGLFATHNTERILRSGAVDYVVRGEGELTFTDLVKALSRGEDPRSIRGISFVENGQVISTPKQDLIKNLDELPMPAYDLVPLQDYAKFSSAPVYASRGCLNSCKFCSLSEFWNFQYRRRSIDRIVEEIKMFKEAGFGRVHFKDESVTLDKKWALDLFGELERADLGVKYKAKSRIDDIDARLLYQMRRAGLDTLHTGIESVSQRSLDAMDKGLTASSIRNIFDLVLNNGCSVNPVYMFSWLGETEADLKESARFIEEMGRRKGVITYISFVTPHPGTRLGAEEMHVLTDDLNRYSHKQPVAVPRSLGPEGLRLMVDEYHRLAEATGTTNVNPRVDPVYLGQILKTYESKVKQEELAAA